MSVVARRPPLVDSTFVSDPPKRLVLEDGFRFHHGERIAPFTLVYETFGELAADRSNAILVCHALSPGAHVAGKYALSDQVAGWWDGLVGYGKGIDLAEHFVVCVNFPGSPWGTTAPATIDPQTGSPYGSRYPWVTVEDMVASQQAVAEHLGIARWKAVVGGSLGGMQVLMWAALHPERVGSIISMAAAASVPVASVGWHLIGRKLVQSDPAFRGGDYYGTVDALRGLQLARMVGHMTYLSDAALEQKFGRRRRGGTRQFEIDSYLEYQGSKFATAYDANSYIRVQAAMDEMDLEERFGSLSDAFRRYGGRALLVSFDTDWLFPRREMSRLAAAMREVGVDVTHADLATPNGHDAFLVDYPLISPLVRVPRRQHIASARPARSGRPASARDHATSATAAVASASTSPLATRWRRACVVGVVELAAASRVKRFDLCGRAKARTVQHAEMRQEEQCIAAQRALTADRCQAPRAPGELEVGLRHRDDRVGVNAQGGLNPGDRREADGLQHLQQVVGKEWLGAQIVTERRRNLTIERVDVGAFDQRGESKLVERYVVASVRDAAGQGVGVRGELVTDRDELAIGDLEEPGQSTQALTHAGRYGPRRLVAEVVLDLGPRVLEQRANLDLATRSRRQRPTSAELGNAEHVMQRAVAEHARFAASALVDRACEIDRQSGFEHASDLIDRIVEVRDHAQAE